MRISRIAIRNFRKLIDPPPLEGLGPGLNVIVGSNEAGKSTVLAALRAALFDRYRISGQAANAMLPYSQAGRPEIEVDFSVRGHDYRLKKAFLQRPEAQLVGGGASWFNETADEELARLLGFAPPGAGRSKPEDHHGIHGLLWVEQGTSHRSLGMGSGARGPVSSALEAEVGEITGGDRGRRLLESAAQRREAFWDRRNNPRGRLKELESESTALTQRRAEIAAQLSTLDGKTDRLGTVKHLLERYRQDAPLEAARLSRLAAEAAQQRLGELQSRLAQARVGVESGRLRHAALADQHRKRTDLRGQLDRSRQDASLLRQALAEAEALVERQRDLLSRADLRLSSAAEGVRVAELNQRRKQAAITAQSHRNSLAQIEAVAAQAEKEELARLATEQLAASTSIDPRQVDQLDKLDAALQAERAKREAASLRLELELQPGKEVFLDGEELRSGAYAIVKDVVVDLPGLGRMILHPGGGVSGLNEAVQTAQRRLSDALVLLDLPNVQAAHSRLARRNEALAERERASRTLASLAPKGLSALREDLARSRLAATTEIETAPDEDAVTLEARVVAARTEWQDAEADRNRLYAAHVQAVAKEETTRSQLADRDSLAQRLSAALSDEIAQTGDTQLEASLADATADLAGARAVLASLETELAEADPERVALQLTRATKAEAAIAADIDKLSVERRDLEIELNTLGLSGLGEALAELDGRRHWIDRELGQLRIEANAARLLHDTLLAAQSETKERWLSPVRRAAAPYLRLLGPDTEIVLDETSLELDQVVRGGVAEPFSNLSMGAREQIAVITRLALADLLRQSGQGSVVVLDDALVNTDAERLERMHLVLHRAAEHQQIIILTCRERDFIGLGAPIFRL